VAAALAAEMSSVKKKRRVWCMRSDEVEWARMREVVWRSIFVGVDKFFWCGWKSVSGERMLFEKRA
jgi:hypothetical protein